jgi:hypothetical protein
MEELMVNWEPLYKRVLALNAQGLSQAEIASLISEEVGEIVTKHAVRHALDRARESIPSLSEMPKPERVPYVTKYLPYILGDTKQEPKDWGTRNRIRTKANAKVLVHADYHIPFHDESKIMDSIEKNIDADAFVMVADFIDAYEISSFDKGMDLPFIFEIDEALRVLEYLSNTFPLVEILEANHEHRVRRQIERNLPPSLQFLAEKSILKLLASPFPNVIVHNDIWFFQLGSAIFSHPEKASRVELKASIDVHSHLSEWGAHYGLEPWNTLVVAHTHTQSVGYTAQQKVMEIGCMAKSQAYAYTPKLTYKRPQRNGYIVMHMRAGMVDWDTTREFTYPIDLR